MTENVVDRKWLHHHGITVLTAEGVANIDNVENAGAPMLIFASAETIGRYYRDLGTVALHAFAGTLEDLRLLRSHYVMREAGRDDIWVPLGSYHTHESDLKVLAEARARSLEVLLPGVTTAVMSLSQILGEE